MPPRKWLKRLAGPTLTEERIREEEQLLVERLKIQQETRENDLARIEREAELIKRRGVTWP